MNKRITLFISLILLGSLVDTLGQGTIKFTNHDPKNNINAPVFTSAGVMLNSGYSAQLYYFNDVEYSPVGGVSAFRDNKQGYFNRLNITPGTFSFDSLMQVRAWENNDTFSTYEESQFRGLSDSFKLTYDPKKDEYLLTNLETFYVYQIPEPSTLLYSFVGILLLVGIKNRKK